MALEPSLNIWSTGRTIGHYKQEGLYKAVEAGIWNQECGGVLLDDCYFLIVGAFPESLREDLEVDRQDEIAVRNIRLKEFLILEN